MNKSDQKYITYIRILKEELIPAMGCTEPIALAYAAAKARDILGSIPDRVLIQTSGSIIKNVKSVIVPNTGYMKGIGAAVAAGIVAGKAEDKLEVLAGISEDEIQRIAIYLNDTPIEIRHIEQGPVFDIIITAYNGSDNAVVRISDYHTNIVFISKNDEIVFEVTNTEKNEEPIANRKLLNTKDIWDFSMTVDITDVRDVLERQIKYNCAIADEGLRGTYGANVGKVLINTLGENSVLVRAKAKAAAGSDARMSGCELPVIINSGSGNQGITCSVPVVEYANELHVTHEQLLRALVISNLTAIYEKSGIGTLSAYCGAVSAGVGAAAGISYLLGGDYDKYKHTVSNALAIASGIICDGAKASCAAKIAISLDSALLAYNMCANGEEFKGGDGLVASDIENTIANIGRLGREGMRQTNAEIIDMMIEND